MQGRFCKGCAYHGSQCYLHGRATATVRRAPARRFAATAAPRRRAAAVAARPAAEFLYNGQPEQASFFRRRRYGRREGRRF